MHTLFIFYLALGASALAPSVNLRTASSHLSRRTTKGGACRVMDVVIKNPSEALDDSESRRSMLSHFPDMSPIEVKRLLQECFASEAKSPIACTNGGTTIAQDCIDKSSVVNNSGGSIVKAADNLDIPFDGNVASGAMSSRKSGVRTPAKDFIPHSFDPADTAAVAGTVFPPLGLQAITGSDKAMMGKLALSAISDKSQHLCPDKEAITSIVSLLKLFLYSFRIPPGTTKQHQLDGESDDTSNPLTRFPEQATTTANDRIGAANTASSQHIESPL